MFRLDARRRACLFAFGLALLCPLQPAAEPASPYRRSLQLVDLTSWVGENIGYKRGFLTATRDGFRWQNGTRARFWGINIANRNLWIPRDEIDDVVDSLAASGTNLVRFEALDSRGGLLEVPGKAGTRVLNSEKLDTLHYWISKLHEKGIYYYLDLIDFREFQPEDGVENAKNLPRAARPYAVFDRRLIELQKEYATQLLTTVNAYTGKAPVDDPGLVLLEICNESGFFLHPKHTDNLLEPYQGRLAKRWNAWLRTRYAERDTLAKVWGTALSKDESPDNDSVKLPQLSRKVRDLRQSDGIMFLHQIEREYFAAMREHLLSIGVQIPISAAVSSDVPADLAAVAAELDFLTENHYYDHPAFGGADWQGKFFHNNKNPLRDDSAGAFGPFTAQLRWDAKPVVVREWATVWPNRYRAISVPEAAAYARLHDIDAMILFGYKTGPVGERLVEFGYQVDAPVWDLFGIGSMLFHRGDIATPTDLTVLEYDDGQLFRGDLTAHDLVRVALSQRLASTRTGGNVPIGDVTVLKPGSAGGSANEWLQQLPVSKGGNALEAGVYTSSNGQIVRDTANGRITLQAPRVLAAAGELAHERLKVGDLEFTTQTPVGALIVQSLDGTDLAQSGQWLMKMVSVAENTGQKLLPAPTGPLPYVLDQPGTAPVRTLGQLAPNGTRVMLWNGDSLSVDQINGTWELLVSGASVRFWSDVPDAAVTYRGRRFLNNAASSVPLRWSNAQPDAYEPVPTFP